MIEKLINKFFFVIVGAIAAIASVSVHAATALEQLGRSIFFDRNLSLNRNQACVSCHVPAMGWSGPNAAFNAAGAAHQGSIVGRFGTRKPPSAAYATFSPFFHLRFNEFVGGNFWDGRATGEKLGDPTADQAQKPFLNPVEQALPDSACVVYRVCNADDYSGQFQQVWGSYSCAIGWPHDIERACATEGATVRLSLFDRMTSDRVYGLIAQSIAAFEGSSEANAFSSKLDQSLQGNVILTAQEQRGFELFKGEARCARCHEASGGKPLFTDFTFENLGVPKNPANPAYNANPHFVDLGLGGFLETKLWYWFLGRANYGKHKIPTLRNVDKRPNPGFVKAYTHNGFFKSLKGIVHFYNTRDIKDHCPDGYTEAQALAEDCWPAPEVAANVNNNDLGNLGLSDEDEDAIVAFLQTLSDGFDPNAH